MEIIKSLCPQPTKQVIIKKKFNIEARRTRYQTRMQIWKIKVEIASASPLKSKLFY